MEDAVREWRSRSSQLKAQAVTQSEGTPSSVVHADGTNLDPASAAHMTISISPSPREDSYRRWNTNLFSPPDPSVHSTSLPQLMLPSLEREGTDPWRETKPGVAADAPGSGSLDRGAFPTWMSPAFQLSGLGGGEDSATISGGGSGDASPYSSRRSTPVPHMHFSRVGDGAGGSLSDANPVNYGAYDVDSFSPTSSGSRSPVRGGLPGIPYSPRLHVQPQGWDPDRGQRGGTAAGQRVSRGVRRGSQTPVSSNASSFRSTTSVIAAASQAPHPSSAPPHEGQARPAPASECPSSCESPTGEAGSVVLPRFPPHPVMEGQRQGVEETNQDGSSSVTAALGPPDDPQVQLGRDLTVVTLPHLATEPSPHFYVGTQENLQALSSPPLREPNNSL